MVLDKWVSDASKLAESLPSNTVVADRVRFLLDNLVSRSVEADINYFDSVHPGTTHLVSESSVLVIGKSQLQKSTTSLGRMAMRLPGVAFVAQGNNVPSVLALAEYSPDKPLGNAATLLHEVEHLTEKEAGLFRPGLSEPFATANLGSRERRAYRLNTDTLLALDGSDFNRYLESWPVSFNVTEQEGSQSAEITFHDIECPTPTHETFAYDMWREGGESRQFLQSIGRMGALEQVTINLSPYLTNYLAGSLDVGASNTTPVV